ncbi:MAG TPA: c-type cytochrome [Burkholderiaceae bacterium]|nr:c-type cytochrome [Burkholderiaceae bacterium]
MRTRDAVAGAVLALAGSGLSAQTPALPANAGYLAGNCANCHGTTGNAKGAMPSLAGQKKDFIVEQMKAFRDGKRTATIMHQLSKGYSDAQIELIADHFARQTPTR